MVAHQCSPVPDALPSPAVSSARSASLPPWDLSFESSSQTSCHGSPEQSAVHGPCLMLSPPESVFDDFSEPEVVDVRQRMPPREPQPRSSNRKRRCSSTRSAGVTYAARKKQKTACVEGPVAAPVAGDVRALTRAVSPVSHTPLVPPTPPSLVVGLKNLRQLCYCNAVIQALFHTPRVRDFFLARKVPEGRRKMEQPTFKVPQRRTRGAARLEQLQGPPVNVNLCDEFSYLVRTMCSLGEPSHQQVGNSKSPKRTPVSPDRFAACVGSVSQFKDDEQHDAQEFLQKIRSHFNEELHVEEDEWVRDKLARHIPVSPNETIMEQAFRGKLLHRITCKSCGHVEKKPEEEFYDLSLNLPDGPTSPPVPTCSLPRLLDTYCAAEPLNLSPSRHCVRCGSCNDFKKSIEFSEMPSVLSFHLSLGQWMRGGKGQRASKGDRGGKVGKINAHTEFPLQGLDMARWQTGRKEGLDVYDLYSIIVHQGTRASSGHYVAFIQHEGQWWRLNDAQVTPVTSEAVAQEKPYLLFYSKRS